MSTTLEEVVKLVDDNINPLLAQHGGRVSVEGVDGTAAYISLSGGCQGCSKAKATLKNFVEQVITSKLPDITVVIDVTDHSQGENPYFKGEETHEEED
jgi:Fe-S cluster biogenesis protein NfuA